MRTHVVLAGPALLAVLSLGCGGMTVQPDALVDGAGHPYVGGDSASNPGTEGTSVMGATASSATDAGEASITGAAAVLVNDPNAGQPPAGCPPDFAPGVGVVDSDGGRCSPSGLKCEYGFNPPSCGGRTALCDNGYWSVWHTDPSVGCFEAGPGSYPPYGDPSIVAAEAGPPLDMATPVRGNGSCASWSTVRGQPFVAASSTSQSVMAILGDATKRMTGSWIGHAISPWGAWDITITFTADNHYVARAYNGTAEGGSTPPPFYYGTESGCDSLKQWRLTGVAATGDVLGQLDVPLSYGPALCGLPTWTGDLFSLVFDASGNRLQFAFRRSDGYGPITYDLWRIC
jgi:hypothetical protein